MGRRKNYVRMFTSLHERPKPQSSRSLLQCQSGSNFPAADSIQFPLEKPLPLPLIRKTMAFRVKASIEKDGKWRA